MVLWENPQFYNKYIWCGKMEHAEAKTSDLVHRGFQAIKIHSSLKQEANNGLTKLEETSEALIKTGHIKWG